VTTQLQFINIIIIIIIIIIILIACVTGDIQWQISNVGAISTSTLNLHTKSLY